MDALTPGSAGTDTLLTEPSKGAATVVTPRAVTLHDGMVAARDDETAKLARFRWRVMFSIFMFGAITMGASTVANILTGESSIFWQDASFLIFLLLSGAAVYQGYLRRPALLLEQLVLLTVCGLFIYHFVLITNAIYSERLTADLFSELVPWLSVIYVASFIVFPVRRAFWLVGSLVAFVSGFWGHRVATLEPYGVRYFAAEALSDTVVASLVAVGLLYFFKRVTEVGAQARMRAVALETLAHTDSLTGLSNRRYLIEKLDGLYLRALEQSQPLTVVLCDLDHFKTINDRFSHGVGDQVLIEVARLLKANTRRGDIVARYGGEEFVLVLTRASAPQARKVCEKIRESIAEYSWSRVHTDLRVTASFGVCGDLSFQTYEAMLAEADKMLYVAKRAGRNRVC